MKTTIRKQVLRAALLAAITAGAQQAQAQHVNSKSGAEKIADTVQVQFEQIENQPYKFRLQLHNPLAQ